MRGCGLLHRGPPGARRARGANWAWRELLCAPRSRAWNLHNTHVETDMVLTGESETFQTFEAAGRGLTVWGRVGGVPCWLKPSRFEPVCGFAQTAVCVPTAAVTRGLLGPGARRRALSLAFYPCPGGWRPHTGTIFSGTSFGDAVQLLLLRHRLNYALRASHYGRRHDARRYTRPCEAATARRVGRRRRHPSLL